MSSSKATRPPPLAQLTAVEAAELLDPPAAGGPPLAADAIELLTVRLADGSQLVDDERVREIVGRLPGMVATTEDPDTYAKLLGIWLRLAESGERRKRGSTTTERIRRELAGIFAELGRRARAGADRAAAAGAATVAAVGGEPGKPSGKRRRARRQDTGRSRKAARRRRKDDQ